MEQIYTIPVNEAFEWSRDDHSCGCPVCTIYNRLEENELDLILGASMMEPDIRIKTNETGFCRTHYDMMFVRKNRLGMALTLESHLAELQKDLTEASIPFVQPKGDKPARRLAKLMDDCYVCGRIEHNFTLMQETAALLWEQDPEFRTKCAAQPFFCLHHFGTFVACAKARMSRRDFGDFYKAVSVQMDTFMDTLNADVSWFVKKFDYRYEDEPWGNAKDAPERAIAFLGGVIHVDEEE